MDMSRQHLILNTKKKNGRHALYKGSTSGGFFTVFFLVIAVVYSSIRINRTLMGYYDKYEIVKAVVRGSHSFLDGNFLNSNISSYRFFPFAVVRADEIQDWQSFGIIDTEGKWVDGELEKYVHLM